MNGRRLLRRWGGLAVVALCTLPAFAAAPYAERYRPQFHFSPRQGWMGDPDGLIRYRGQYHLFWWGHAVSRDLVRWTELPWPMLGGDDSFMYYTGSVVVDEANTGGWGADGQPAMVAIYTAHDRTSGLENQRLSISTNYTSFHYYSGNPVLNLNSRSHRDPDVFWYAPGGRWIMAIALPDERKVQFYASADLKTWRFLSAFGPAAARAPLWETPNLFQLPLDGDRANLKWVLVCSLGPNKVQYFVGDFDGRTFTQDPADLAYLTRGRGLAGEVFEDFEGRTIGAWSASGAAFGRGPFHAKPAASGFLGKGVGSSSSGGDAATGRLRSPPFTIERPSINFLIGGQDRPGDACLHLLVSGRVARTATGRNSEHLAWSGWKVADLRGQEAYLEIVDRSEDGHIDVDHILFSDVLFDTGREHANWVDWGLDFYAARAYRDYDDASGPTVWLGWMGNWDYANQVPTSWGRGAQSIPRELALVSAEKGYELVQRPLPALQTLRGPATEVASRGIEGVVPLKEFRPARNVYELEAEFGLDSAGGRVGLHLCIGGGDKVVLAYDAVTANVTLDRRTSGDVSFNPHFARVSAAPLPGRSDRIKFRVFVDQSSIEVFVNDGQAVLTSQIFPRPGSTGIALFAEGGPAVLRRLAAWELASIWP